MKETKKSAPGKPERKRMSALDLSTISLGLAAFSLGLNVAFALVRIFGH